jgi:2,3-bisphosphoglycerate-dependent phosphoglycerate mutase
MQEAKNAGEKLRPYRFDRAFTSVLQRANDTLRLVLEVIGQPDIPTEKNKALNERMYGDLQGLNKAETAKKYGEEQVKIWRRSYDVRPCGTLSKISRPVWSVPTLVFLRGGRR